jgi:cysteine desulfurase
MDAARQSGWANPSSVHAAGRASRALLEQARCAIACALGAEPADIVLTAGGTEACNLGLLQLADAGRRHVVTTAVEHPAVAAPLAALEASGVRVTRLPVEAGRPPDPQGLANALASDTAMCALAWVNHETGTIFPIQAYGELCRERGARLFVDATQALGKLPIDVASLAGVDLLAVASHKAGGPAGAGALWVRRGMSISPAMRGGAQERGRRGGTPDVLSAVGFGAACAALRERVQAQARLRELRRTVERSLVELGAVLNAAGFDRTSSVVNASFAGQRGDELVAALDLLGVCVSSGAACSSGLSEPSPVLLAMYPGEEWRASAALRFSFGPETTEIEMKTALDALCRVLRR